MPAVRPANSGGYWPLTHRWVWRRSRLRQAIADAASGMTAVFVCGIAGNQTEMMDILHQVLLLVIDEQTQEARLAGSPRQASLLSGSRSELADQSSRRTRCRRGLAPRGETQDCLASASGWVISSRPPPPA